MKWTFVLKDKGTPNQGWWLKISSIDELIEYVEATHPTTYGEAFENYVKGKEYGGSSLSHGPHIEKDPITRAIVMYAQSHNNPPMTFIQAIEQFRLSIVERQIHEIEETGCIYINCVGGYHGSYKGEPKLDFVRRESLVFPDFKKSDIRILQFQGVNITMLI